MSTHIEITCPNCARPLKVREAYFGHRVACKQCGHAFVAERPDGPPSSGLLDIEALWERENRHAEVAKTPPRPSAARPAEGRQGLGTVQRVPNVDLEDSSALIPVRREPEEPATSEPAAPPTPTPAPTDESFERPDLLAQIQSLRSENAWLKAEVDSLRYELEQLRDRNGAMH